MPPCTPARAAWGPLRCPLPLKFWVQAWTGLRHSTTTLRRPVRSRCGGHRASILHTRARAEVIDAARTSSKEHNIHRLSGRRTIFGLGSSTLKKRVGGAQELDTAARHYADSLAQECVGGSCGLQVTRPARSIPAGRHVHTRLRPPGSKINQSLARPTPRRRRHTSCVAMFMLGSRSVYWRRSARAV